MYQKTQPYLLDSIKIDYSFTIYNRKKYKSITGSTFSRTTSQSYDFTSYPEFHAYVLWLQL